MHFGVGVKTQQSKRFGGVLFTSMYFFLSLAVLVSNTLIINYVKRKILFGIMSEHQKYPSTKIPDPLKIVAGELWKPWYQKHHIPCIFAAFDQHIEMYYVKLNTHS